CQFETETRIALRPRQVVPLSQTRPLSCTWRSASSVCSSDWNRKSTWLSTTSFSSSAPGGSTIASAKRVAASQQRSTSSTTPERPSERSAAYTANPRARRENSGTQSIWSRTRREPSSWIRYDALTAIAARCDSGWAQRTSPESYGTFSHLCASVVHESASSIPLTRCRSRGETAAQIPKPPSTCTHPPPSPEPPPTS